MPVYAVRVFQLESRIPLLPVRCGAQIWQIRPGGEPFRAQTGYELWSKTNWPDPERNWDTSLVSPRLADFWHV